MNDPENMGEAPDPKPDENKKQDVETVLAKLEQRLAAAEQMAKDAALRLAEVDNGDSAMAAGDDFFDLRPPMMGGGGGSGLDGFYFILANGTITVYISTADVMSDYDPSPGGAAHTDWSIEFDVATGEISATTAPELAFNNTAARYDLDGSGNQTKYRLAVVRGGKLLSVGGVYRENHIWLTSGIPIVELVGTG